MIALPNSFRGLLVTLLLLLLTTGCNEQQKSAAAVKEAPPETEEPLQIGLIPEHDIFTQKGRYEPLGAYLTRQLGRKVELKILPQYGNIVEKFRNEELDGAFFGSFTGALAIERMGVVPLARPEYKDGRSTYYGMILVRKDSGIRTASDMRGKRFAFVDKATTAGWLLPLHYFAEAGIRDYRAWLGEFYFTGTHEDAIMDVLNGTADIGAAKNTVFDRLAAKNPRLDNELEILAVSPKVPANGLAVRRNLAPLLRDRLKKILLEMDQTPQGKVVLDGFGALRFVETGIADYLPVFEYARHVEIDLATYDFLNY